MSLSKRILKASANIRNEQITKTLTIAVIKYLSVSYKHQPNIRNKQITKTLTIAVISMEDIVIKAALNYSKVSCIVTPFRVTTVQNKVFGTFSSVPYYRKQVQLFWTVTLSPHAI